jgi:hypothetical protein
MAPTESVKRGPTKKNAVINYCVILSYYTIDDCRSVIRGPRAMHLKYCYNNTFTVYCKRRRAIFAHYFIPSASERISRKTRADSSHTAPRDRDAIGSDIRRRRCSHCKMSADGIGEICGPGRCLWHVITIPHVTLCQI